jgi:hypothetical protein
MDNDREHKVERQYRSKGVLGGSYAGTEGVLGKSYAGTEGVLGKSSAGKKIAPHNFAAR